jgi:succinyl-diaminopimelate desuccinylase
MLKRVQKRLLMSYCGIKMIDPILIAQALIRCPSVTPDEGGAIHYLAELLRAAGFKVDRPVFEEAGTPSIENFFAIIGNGAPCLVFAGHTDVVPVGDEAAWNYPPFGAEIHDGILYGRGAEDMKGGVAASIASVLQYLQEHGAPKTGSIAFLITGDEEGPAINGTVKLLKWAIEKGYTFNHCVLGEPTNPNYLGEMIKAGRRGSLSGEIIVRGKQGHVAYPHLAANPIPLLCELVLALKQQPLDEGTAEFSASNLEFTSINVGNTASNVIPAQAKANFNIRFNTLWTPQTLEAEICKRLSGFSFEGVSFEVQFKPTNAVAFITKAGAFTDLVRNSVQHITGKIPEISTSGGTSDARFIKDYCEVVECGLVGQTMHQVNERVLVEDIEVLTKIYGKIIEGYFSAD